MVIEELYTDWDGSIAYVVQKALKDGQVFRTNEESVPDGFRPIYEARKDGVRGWVLEPLCRQMELFDRDAPAKPL